MSNCKLVEFFPIAYETGINPVALLSFTCALNQSVSARSQRFSCFRGLDQIRIWLI